MTHRNVHVFFACIALSTLGFSFGCSIDQGDDEVIGTSEQAVFGETVDSVPPEDEPCPPGFHVIEDCPEPIIIMKGGLQSVVAPTPEECEPVCEPDEPPPPPPAGNCPEGTVEATICPAKAPVTHKKGVFSSIAPPEDEPGGECWTECVPLLP